MLQILQKLDAKYVQKFNLLATFGVVCIFATDALAPSEDKLLILHYGIAVLTRITATSLALSN